MAKQRTRVLSARRCLIAMWVVISIFSAALLARGLFGVGQTPLVDPVQPDDTLTVDPPTTHSTAASSTGQPSVSPTAARPSQATASAGCTVQPSATIRDPRGNPKRIKIVSAAGEILVHKGLESYQMGSDRVLNPPGGVAVWLNEGQPKPGELSKYNSLIAAHVGGDGRTGVFYWLSKARECDIVLIEYDSGDQVTALIVRNPVRIERDAVFNDPQYNWVKQLGNTPDRVISLITCTDRTSTAQNWVTQARVIQVK